MVVAENVASAGFDIQPRLEIISDTGWRACKALGLDRYDGSRTALEKIRDWLERHPEAFAESNPKGRGQQVGWNRGSLWSLQYERRQLAYHKAEGDQWGISWHRSQYAKALAAFRAEPVVCGLT